MKSHQLIKLTASLYNTPHLVNKTTFEVVTNYLHSRNSKNFMVLDDDSSSEEPEEKYDPMSTVGVISIHGALSYKDIYGSCGEIRGCSYTSILEQASEMISEGATIIVLDCDSGGGEGYGVFECSNELRKMADDAGVKIYAYNDGCMASACYGMACVADEVISNPFAETGSIGVLIALLNDSKHLENEGYSRTFISAGASKIPFDDKGNWREGFLESLQERVDALYDSFAQHVSDYTGLSTEDVKATEAQMFSAEKALELGLINSIKTRSEFVNYIISKQEANNA